MPSHPLSLVLCEARTVMKTDEKILLIGWMVWSFEFVLKFYVYCVVSVQVFCLERDHTRAVANPTLEVF